MTYDLLIWDCDGCLIDSEWIGCAVEAQGLTEAGYPITTEQMIERFCGVSVSECFQQFEAEIGRDLRSHPALKGQDDRLRQAFERELEPITGIHETLIRLESMYPALQMCITSGSSMNRLEHTLTLTNLHERFAEKYFSAEDVAKGKPAPDIFLKAAHQMGVDPHNCLVIEDSPLGINAAHSAQMRVLGFTGGSHGGEKLHNRLVAQNPYLIFNDMKDLPEILRQLNMLETS